ncbi:MAG TPA: DUF5985 family protein [Gemmatimonas sp.]|nr:DUF5985 family protein [Gemmatimonas sp.]
MTPERRAFAEGMLTVGYAVAALFFLRFWRESTDRLFAFFAASFALLAVQRAILAVMQGADDHSWWIYLIRLVAYLLILFAIYDKNRAERGIDMH